MSPPPTVSPGRSSGAEPLSAQPLRPVVGRGPELARLGRVLGAARDGGSGALVVRGEPGIGKSALLEHVTAAATGFDILRAVGVEGEIDLPYAGLHQLCRPLLDQVVELPEPQRDALRVAFGLAPGDLPDRYVVGLAALSLMSAAAVRQPLLCVVDDAQWLDGPTAQALAFVGRRLGADSVSLVISTRSADEVFEGIPELGLGGLSTAESRRVLGTVLVGRVDEAVRERILAEAHGNPLALMELPRTLTAAETATGIVQGTADSLTSRLEAGYRRRLEALPENTRTLLVIAAADPLGDPLLLLRAASHLGVGVEAADAAEAANLLEIKEHVTFRHPLVRSTAYRSASANERRAAHAALADATDPDLEPDRRVWHRAQASAVPDEKLAAELEQMAERARARGGLAASAAFLESAVRLTPDPAHRSERALAAAEQKVDAGAFGDAERLLRTAATGSESALVRARTERLAARIDLARAFDDREALNRALDAARRLLRLDPKLGREALLEAFLASRYTENREVCIAVGQVFVEHAEGTGSDAIELLLGGYALLLSKGYPAGTDLLTQALHELRSATPSTELEAEAALQAATTIAPALWDFESMGSIMDGLVHWVREAGVLRLLPKALQGLTWAQIYGGAFRDAAAALTEADAVEAVTGGASTPANWAILHAWCQDERVALDLIAECERKGAQLPDTEYARALLFNGLGRYDLALAAAQRSCDAHQVGAWGSALVEMVEAAVRSADSVRAVWALDQLVTRTRKGGTDWALGLEARARALMDDVDPEDHYREAIERLARTPLRPDLARAHLLYGEWLRRVHRRVDARAELVRAHELFSAMGAAAFTDRTRRELVATGEHVRRRVDDRRIDLTAQERQIARLASTGLTNAEIAGQMFLSARTVEWHLRQVFGKLGIASRRELRTAIPPS
jgi:DNA-binding CsgD family transcriptional regulator/tetratricopeptide (TPR) repeat protein